MSNRHFYVERCGLCVNCLCYSIDKKKRTEQMQYQNPLNPLGLPLTSTESSSKRPHAAQLKPLELIGETIAIECLITTSAPQEDTKRRDESRVSSISNVSPIFAGMVSGVVNAHSEARLLTSSCHGRPTEVSPSLGSCNSREKRHNTAAHRQQGKTIHLRNDGEFHCETFPGTT